MKRNFGILFAATVVMMAGAMTGCEKPDSGEYPTSHVTRLEGIVTEGMDMIAHETKPFSLKLRVYGGGYPGFGEVASGSLSADGAFSMELPYSVDAALLELGIFGGMEGLTVSNPGTKTVFGIELGVFDGEGISLGTIEYGSWGNRGMLIFADGDCTISGTYIEQNVDATITCYLNLKRGWNWVFSYNDDWPNTGIRTEIPSDARYYLSVPVP
jgi:hypothetical protein